MLKEKGIKTFNWGSESSEIWRPNGFFSHYAVFRHFSTPKIKGCIGIKVWHWINLSNGTGFLSLSKLLTEICLFKPHLLINLIFLVFRMVILEEFFYFCTYLILYFIRFRKVLKTCDWLFIFNVFSKSKTKVGHGCLWGVAVEILKKF